MVKSSKSSGESPAQPIRLTVAIRGKIGLVAPSFGAAIEPYRSALDRAVDKFQNLGYEVIKGPNCYAGDGIGISSTPLNCGTELESMYLSEKNDILISCGGGEMMCEILDYVDFDKIKKGIYFMRFILPRFFINCERWKWNDDLRVFVSTFGHVKDEHKKNVAPKINDNGYFVVRVKDKWISVHRLVLLTWRPIPNDGEPMTVDHLDSNRRNNRLDNLEWVSQDENLRRANEMLCKNKEANCEGLPNLLGPLVNWEDLCEKCGFTGEDAHSPYTYTGSIECAQVFWRSSSSLCLRQKLFRQLSDNLSY